MEFRLSRPEDADAIFSIIQQAQAYFRSIKNPQWQNGYPNPDVIREDIRSRSSYVLLENGRIVATAVLLFTGEPTYDRIYAGQWLGDGPYGTIHRIAVSEAYKGRGASVRMLRAFERECEARGICFLRVDTHDRNRPMRRFLEKNGFARCGIIYLADRSERIAFEKRLRP